jgi:hypothetical protein
VTPLDELTALDPAQWRPLDVFTIFTTAFAHRGKPTDFGANPL